MAYNGWTNYETWCVNLWLDNERATYEDKRQIIRDADEQYQAAIALKSYVEDMLPDLGASMFADLLGAALSEVDWQEIIESDWDELHEKDAEEEADA